MSISVASRLSKWWKASGRLAANVANSANCGEIADRANVVHLRGKWRVDGIFPRRRFFFKHNVFQYVPTYKIISVFCTF